MRATTSRARGHASFEISSSHAAEAWKGGLSAAKSETNTQEARTWLNRDHFRQRCTHERSGLDREQTPTHTHTQ